MTEKESTDKEMTEKESIDKETTETWRTSVAPAPTPTPPSPSRWSCPLAGRERRATRGQQVSCDKARLATGSKATGSAAMRPPTTSASASVAVGDSDGTTAGSEWQRRCDGNAAEWRCSQRDAGECYDCGSRHCRRRRRPPRYARAALAITAQLWWVTAAWATRAATRHWRRATMATPRPALKRPATALTPNRTIRRIAT